MQKLTSRLSQNPVKLTDKAWHLFVNRINKQYRIPDDYKQFLYQYNGGAFNEYMLHNTDIGDLVVNYFYSIEGDDELSLLTLIDFGEELGKGLLPIADDPGGNYFLLNMNQVNNGQMYYWLHDGLFADGSNKMLLSHTFSDFINALKAETPY